MGSIVKSYYFQITTSHGSNKLRIIYEVIGVPSTWIVPLFQIWSPINIPHIQAPIKLYTGLVCIRPVQHVVIVCWMQYVTPISASSRMPGVALQNAFRLARVKFFLSFFVRLFVVIKTRYLHQCSLFLHFRLSLLFLFPLDLQKNNKWPWDFSDARTCAKSIWLRLGDEQGKCGAICAFCRTLPIQVHWTTHVGKKIILNTVNICCECAFYTRGLQLCGWRSWRTHEEPSAFVACKSIHRRGKPGERKQENNSRRVLTG